VSSAGQTRGLLCLTARYSVVGIEWEFFTIDFDAAALFMQKHMTGDCL
jgi:hypothetical protein